MPILKIEKCKRKNFKNIIKGILLLIVKRILRGKCAFVCYVLREIMVAMEEIPIRKNERKVTWILQYGFRPCHNSVIQSIQWLHDRGKLILYTSI
jgi:hypothetical protein